jgi:hypothetical protein
MDVYRMSNKNQIIAVGRIQERIFTIRGVQVMLDRDLAVLYETETRTLKQTVKRNIDRFPPDFMFELSDEDIKVLVSQSVIPSKKHLGGAVPYAFTEQGDSMPNQCLKIFKPQRTQRAQRRGISDRCVWGAV